MEKIQVHNLIILDESGSMEDIKKQVISGFNETVQTIKASQEEFPDQEQYITFVSFNSSGINTIRFAETADKLREIDGQVYKPNGGTPLFDAMGFSILRLENHLRSLNPDSYRVLVTILTDGYENASREYSASVIKTLVERLKTGNWTFVYVGTDHDVETITQSISIDNSMYFDKSEADMDMMFSNERNSRRAYYRNVSEKSEKFKDFFDNKSDKKKK